MTAEKITSVAGKKSVVVKEGESVVDKMTRVVEKMSPALVFRNSDPDLLPVF
jgi:hypothetical protein